jgi:hypothetical protein
MTMITIMMATAARIRRYIVAAGDGSAGPANTLFFSSGPDSEMNGLFGAITPFNGLDGDEE